MSTCIGCHGRGGWEDGDEGQWVTCLHCVVRQTLDIHFDPQAPIAETIVPIDSRSITEDMKKHWLHAEGLE